MCNHDLSYGKNAVTFPARRVRMSVLGNFPQSKTRGWHLITWTEPRLRFWKKTLVSQELFGEFDS